MTDRRLKSGYSLTELLVVVSIIATLAGLGLPAVRHVIKSFESSSRVRDVVSAAFSSARAMAIRDAKYTGIRFQQDNQGNQHMVFIQQDENVGPWKQGNSGFRAIQGRNPIRLPKQGILIDMRMKTNYALPVPNSDPRHPYETEISLIPSQFPDPLTDQDRDDYLTQENVLLDIKTFSVVFAPSGKLVMKTLKVSYASDGAGSDIFNTQGAAMFIHDENGNPIEGLQIESSRNNFVIVDKIEFNKIPSNKRWTEYLKRLKPIYINPYSGELID